LAESIVIIEKRWNLNATVPYKLTIKNLLKWMELKATDEFDHFLRLTESGYTKVVERATKD
jgi:hypothetical protein